MWFLGWKERRRSYFLPCLPVFILPCCNLLKQGMASCPPGPLESDVVCHLSSTCVPVVSQMSSTCLSHSSTRHLVVSQLFWGCLPLVFQLCPDCLPDVSQIFHRCCLPVASKVLQLLPTESTGSYLPLVLQVLSPQIWSLYLYLFTSCRPDVVFQGPPSCVP